MHQTSSKLHFRDSKACRVLSHKFGFGIVRRYRTFSNYIFTEETRCAGYLCTSSRWFNRIEPPQTFPNNIISEIARCVEFVYMSSGWFDFTEPSLTASLLGKQGAWCTSSGSVQAQRTSLNLLDPHHRRDSKVCSVLSHYFGVV